MTEEPFPAREGGTDDATSQAESAAPREIVTGAVVAGKYRVVRLLGSGGMGRVFLVSHVALNRLFAVKVLNSRRSKPSLARFEREARAMARLESDHVAKVVDFGWLDQQSPFLVMEYLEGSDLRRELMESGALGPNQAALHVFQACHALAEAHGLGIIHRDIKPSNLFLARKRGHAPSIKVLDFGVSKSEQDEGGAGPLTAATAKVGSPPYMSPEQICSPHLVDQRADIWSLGVVLFELTTGALPFRGEGDSLYDAILQRVPPSPSSLRPDLPPALERLILQCLSKDRVQRPPDVREVAAQLSPLCGAEARLLLERISGLVADSSSPVPLDASGLDALTPPSTTTAVSGEHRTSNARRPQDRVVGSLAGCTLTGGARLGQLLGHGAMGEVYEATLAGESVAVKVLRIDVASDDDLVARFVEEARATALVEHAHVVRVTEASIDEATGRPFLVMELLKGRTLEALIANLGAIETTAVLRLAIQACEALGAAHAHAVIHRDIKPANLFLHEETGGRVSLKLCDFGIAKIMGPDGISSSAERMTQASGILGSLAYMSPEQIKAPRDVDQRSDLWSLGVTLYEALSGRLPWRQGASQMDLGVAICTEEPIPLSAVAPWIDPKLAAHVENCIRRDIHSRWQSTTDLESALRAIEDDPQLSHRLLIAASRQRSFDTHSDGQGIPPVVPPAPVTAGARRRVRVGLAITSGLAISALLLLLQDRGRGAQAPAADTPTSSEMGQWPTAHTPNGAASVSDAAQPPSPPTASASVSATSSARTEVRPPSRAGGPTAPSTITTTTPSGSASVTSSPAPSGSAGVLPPGLEIQRRKGVDGSPNP